MRVDMFKGYRLRHGKRIRLDMDGETSVEVALQLRLGWASQDWIEAMSEIRDQFLDAARMARWGVINPAGEADQHLLATFEAMARTFWGLHARGFVLWLGGPYVQVKLCSSDASKRLEAVGRARALWKRFRILEVLVSQEDVDPDLKDFWAGCFWPFNVPYRELLILISEGRLDEAVMSAWRIHSSVCHEKGVP